MSKLNNIFNKAVLTGGLLLGAYSASSQNVTILPNKGGVSLAWDRSPDASVVGYRIYYGIESGGYTNSKTIGNITNTTIENLLCDQEYYFAATAFDGAGLESVYSNETSFSMISDAKAVYNNINGNSFYEISHIRTINDEVFPFMQSQNASNWSKTLSAQKISENEISLGVYSTTWRVPASQPPVKQMYFMKESSVYAQNPLFKLKPGNIKKLVD